MSRRISLCLALCLLWPTVGWSQTTFWPNYGPLLLGGRTAIMGGSGVAIGTDSAMPVLNPAGLAAVGRSHISMSASVYNLTALEVEDYYTAGDGDTDPLLDDPSTLGPVSQNRTQHFDSFPSSFVYSWPFGENVGKAGHHVLSFFILTPRRLEERWTGFFALVSVGSQVNSTTYWMRSRSEYRVGPSYALQLSKSFRLGMTAGLGYTHSQDVYLTQATFEFGSEANLQSTLFTSRSHSLVFMPNAGFQWAMTDHFHLGAAVTAPSLYLDGQFTREVEDRAIYGTTLAIDGGLGPGYVGQINIKVDDYQVRMPVVGSVGLAYDKPNSWALSVDVHYYGPLQYTLGPGQLSSKLRGLDGRTTVEGEVLEEEVKGAPVINANAGLRINVDEDWAMGFGAFTDISPTLNLKSGPTTEYLNARQIDKYGATTGFTAYLGPMDFTAGLAYIMGFGKFGATKDFRESNSTTYYVTDAEAAEVRAFITGGVSFGEAAKPLADISKIPIDQLEPLFEQHDPGVITLPEIHPDFGRYAGTALDALAARIDVRGKPDPVQYERVGDPDFDNFFKEAARIEGALVMAQGAISRMGEALLDLRAWAETQSGQWRMPRSDSALLAKAIQLSNVETPKEVTEAIASIDQGQKMVQTAVMVIMKALPKAIRLGARLLSEAPDRLKKQGPAALTTTLIALRNAQRMIKSFGMTVGAIQDKAKSFVPAMDTEDEEKSMDDEEDAEDEDEDEQSDFEDLGGESDDEDELPDPPSSEDQDPLD